jgi:hypothetical protein
MVTVEVASISSIFSEQEVDDFDGSIPLMADRIWKSACYWLVSDQPLIAKYIDGLAIHETK